MKKNFQTDFKIGDLTIPSNVLYAPLSGHTDLAFRKVCQKFRPGLFFCEMVKMDALVRNHPSTIDLLSYNEDMHPLGAQIFGSNPSFAGPSAKMIEEMGFDLLDLNCGCPVRKVTKDGSGSGLLKTPEKIGDILSEMISAVKIPVTVKIRIGWDSDDLVALKILEIAQKAGAKAITIHGRTTVQGYRGEADWSLIKACADEAKSIKVIGNGDLFTHDKVFQMFDETGCDGVMIGRGMLGHPSLVEDVYNHAKGKVVQSKTLVDVATIILMHFDYLANYFSDNRIVFQMKRVACWYLKGHDGMKKFRTAIMASRSVQDVMQVLNLLISQLEPEDSFSLQKSLVTLEDKVNG